MFWLVVYVLGGGGLCFVWVDVVGLRFWLLFVGWLLNVDDGEVWFFLYGESIFVFILGSVVVLCGGKL